VFDLSGLVQLYTELNELPDARLQTVPEGQHVNAPWQHTAFGNGQHPTPEPLNEDLQQVLVERSQDVTFQSDPFCPGHGVNTDNATLRVNNSTTNVACLYDCYHAHRHVK